MKVNISKIVNLLPLAVIAVGCVVFVGWMLDITILKSFFPGHVAMKVNTALCFILAGVSLLILQKKGFGPQMPLIVRACSLVVIMIGFLTLCEYFSGRDLGIDQFLYSEWSGDMTDTFNANRIAPVASFNFVLAGAASFILASGRAYWISNLSAFLGILISFFNLFGYLFGIRSLYAVAPYTPIAVPTAAAFLILFTGLFLLGLKRDLPLPGIANGLPSLLSEDQVRQEKWASERKNNQKAFALALGLLIVIAIALYRNTARFQAAEDLKSHYHEIYREGSELKVCMVDAETGQRGFIITGKEDFLDPYNAALREIDKHLIKIKELVSDDPNFAKEAGSLEPLVNKKIYELRKTISIRRKEGLEAASAVVSVGAGKNIMDQLRGVINEMIGKAEELRRRQNAAIQVSAHNTMVTVILGNIASFILLIMIFFRLQKDLIARQESDAVNSKLALIVNSSDDAIISKTLDGVVTSWNKGAERMFGYTPEEIIGSPMTLLIPPDHLDEEARILNKLQNGEHVKNSETVRVCKDGRQIHVLVTVSPIKDSAGRIIGASKIVRDITERKLAEEELKRNKAQLEVTNKELEAFSYSVSHDLRAPLRHIDGFVDILQKNAAASLDEKNRRYLNIISDSARQMGTLIDDLLVFSKMGRTEMKGSLINMDELTGEIVSSIKMDFKERNIDWKISALPKVFADPALLKQVLVNLVQNAVKYTGTRPKAQIEIGSAGEKNGEVVYFVRDNGVGFDMQYVNKLFGVFQRLHSTEEFEGTGIGLANVRRIIARHGGKTWAEGVVDGGAAFYFSLPK